ncbi:P-loop containing nucleoside triphosphate hydrolase protein [Ramicandelaber brevisporus]|nr:P-loop containing nucleoside triphosphate hydrolase protein [Ramicandelaber brevisporus]
MPKRGIAWKNLVYQVTSGWGKGRTTRHILKGISGDVQPGEFVAIIGSSGAGKTSLLNILAGRNCTGKVTGTVLFDGHKRIPGVFKRRSSYVEQEDRLYGTLTVRETIWFHAQLRLPDTSYSMEEKEERVNNVVKTLRLEDVADHPIGDPDKRGISGGERKRVAIGCELVVDPDVIFLDEATSGLDSSSALTVLDTARSIAHDGNKCVIMTIHQPSAKLLQRFDRIMLLADGEVVHYGTLRETLSFFATAGYPCPDLENPADHFIDMLTVDHTSDETRMVGRDRVSTIPQFPSVPASGGTKESAGSLPVSSKPLYVGWAIPWLKEVRILMYRAWITTLRNKPLMFVGLARTILLTLLLGLSYFQLEWDQNSIQNRMGVMYFLPINQGFTLSLPLLFVFVLDRDIMIRERFAGAYRTSTFFLSRLAVEMPFTIVYTVAMGSAVYWMVGMQPHMHNFLIFNMMTILVSLCAIALALAIGTASPSVRMAQVLCPMIITVYLLFGGALHNNRDIPVYFRWIRYISMMTYASNGLMLNEFRGLHFSCSIDAAVVGCVTRGEGVLQRFHLDDFSIAQCAYALSGMIVVYLLLTYLALRYRTQPKVQWI